MRDKALDTLSKDPDWSNVNWRSIPDDVVHQATFGRPVRRPTPEERRALGLPKEADARHIRSGRA